MWLILAIAVLQGGDRPADPATAAASWIGGDVAGTLAALEATPASRQRELNRGVVLLYLGEAERALCQFEKLRERDPRWTPAARWLARAQEVFAPEAALDGLSGFLEMPGITARDRLWAAQLFEAHGDRERARAELTRAVREDQGLSLAWLGLSRLDSVARSAGAGPLVSVRGAALFEPGHGELPPPVLRGGESLRYRVKYLFFRLATLSIDTEDTRPADGAAAFRVSVKARSHGIFGLFHIDSRFISRLAPDGTSLFHLNVSNDSDSGRHAASYEMDPARGRCTVRYVEDGLFGFDVLPLPARAQDGITGLLLLRAVARARATLIVPTAVDLTWKQTSLRTVGVETIRWRGQDVRCVHVQSEGDYRGPAGLAGTVDVWVSDDSRSVPIRARMKIAVGSVVLELLPAETADNEEAPAPQAAGRSSARWDPSSPRSTCSPGIPCCSSSSPGARGAAPWPRPRRAPRAPS